MAMRGAEVIAGANASVDAQELALFHSGLWALARSRVARLGADPEVAEGRLRVILTELAKEHEPGQGLATKATARFLRELECKGHG